MFCWNAQLLSPAFKKSETLKSVFNFTLWGLPGKQLLRHLCCCHQAGKGKPHEQALVQVCSLLVGLWAHASKNLELLQQTTDSSKQLEDRSGPVLKVTVPSEPCSTHSWDRVLLCLKQQIVSLQCLTKLCQVSRLSHLLCLETGISQGILAFWEKKLTQAGTQLSFGMHPVSTSKILPGQTIRGCFIFLYFYW